MSSGETALRQRSQGPAAGIIVREDGTSPFGNLLIGAGRNSYNKTQMLLLDRTATGTNVSAASHGEVYQLDQDGGENGLMVYATTRSGAPAVGGPKSAIRGRIVATENTSGGGLQAPAYGVSAYVETGAGSTATIGAALHAVAALSAGRTGLYSALRGALSNNSASANANVGQSTSTYALYLETSAANTKGSAFAYAAKAADALTCTHGYVVAADAVDTAAFGVISGASTVLWGVSPTGKMNMSTADVTIADLAAGATVTTPSGRILVTSTTVNAASNATLAVTAAGLCTSASHIIITIQGHPGTIVTNGIIQVGLAAAPGSGTFTINVTNVHAANNCAAQAGLRIGYMILN